LSREVAPGTINYIKLFRISGVGWRLRPFQIKKGPR
jgi:hypothetical protein